MQRVLVIGLAAAIVGIGAGVGIGAAVWSGSSSGSGTTNAPRAFSPTTSIELKGNKLNATRYDDGFTIYAKSKSLTFTPDDDSSSCGSPGALTATGYFMGGTGLYQYKGTAEINDSGSCWFKNTYLYWNGSNGGRLNLFHSQGSYGCESGCHREGGQVSYLVYG